MPETKGMVDLKGNIDTIFNHLKNIHKFDQSLDGVTSISREDLDGEDLITNWKIMIEEAPVKWREKSLISNSEYKINFELIDGDLDQWTGYWLLTEDGDNITIKQKIDYKFGFGVLDSLNETIVNKKLTTWNQRFLNSLSQKIKAEEDSEVI